VAHGHESKPAELEAQRIDLRTTGLVVADSAGLGFELAEEGSADSVAARCFVDVDTPDFRGIWFECLQAAAADRTVVEVGDDPGAPWRSETPCLLGILKPSDGLEPSTHSLPWRFWSGNRGQARSSAITFVLQIQTEWRAGSVPAWTRVLLLMYPPRTRGPLAVLRT
jgi:hypothetical protein